jgi:hypothetical protein|tara:strand:- start:5414 stop:8686 length:3273 start_codon:yes stop_codon:yes gene_type:complete
MATYIKGADTYLPDIKPFTPDYKFLSAVLETRQDKYDTNFKATNDLYNKVVYADLSRNDTKERRDQYAEQIAPQIEKISGMDLSLAQNVNAAKDVFAPFYEDDITVKDVVYTSRYREEMKTANLLLNSPDRTVQAKYWKTGERAMQYQMDAFINADPDKALQMGLPKYVPDANLFEMSQQMLENMDPPLKMKRDRFAKKANPKFNPNKPVSETNQREIANSDWIITEQNGAQVTGAALQQIRNRLMEAPRVQAAYQTEAYVKGMDWATQAVNEGRAANIEQGQELWASETIRRLDTINELRMAQDMQALSKAEKANVSWANYKGANGIIEGSQLDQANTEQLSRTEQFKAALEAKKRIREEAALPSKTLGNTLNKAYSMLMQNNIMGDMREAAQAWSARDYEYEMRENKYALQDKQFKMDMSKIRANAKNALNLEGVKQKNRVDLEVLKTQLEGSRSNSPLGDAVSTGYTTLGDGNTIDLATNKKNKITQNPDMIQRTKDQFTEADGKLAGTQVNDIVNMMSLMNPRGDNSSQDQTYGIQVTGENGELKEFRGSIEQIKTKLLEQTTNEEGVSTGYKNRDLIAKIYSDKNTEFTNTRQQALDNPNMVLSRDQRTSYDQLYEKMNGINGTNTQVKGVEQFVQTAYNKFEEANTVTTASVKKEEKHVRNLMDNGNFPNIFKDGIPLNKEEYINMVKEGIKDGTITNVNLDWKVDTGTNNKDYMIQATETVMNEYTGTTIYLKNPDGSKKMVLDDKAVDDEAGMVYDALKKGLNKRLTGQQDSNVNSGDFNSARYGINGSFTDVVSNPTYNYSINPLVNNPDNEQEMANMINQVKSLQSNNTPYGLGVGRLNKDSELLSKNALASKVYNLWLEDLNTWINNPKRSNTDAIAPIGVLAYMPVYDKANVGDKTHAGYELKFSSEWLASKVKGPKGAEYGALTKDDLKKLKGVGEDNNDSGIFLVFDQQEDLNVKAKKNDYYSSTEIDILGGDNSTYHDYTVPNDNGITNTADYRVVKNGTGNYMLDYSVNYYNPYDPNAENYTEYTTDTGTVQMDFRNGLMGIDQQMIKMQAQYQEIRRNNQALREKDQAIYGKK